MTTLLTFTRRTLAAAACFVLSTGTALASDSIWPRVCEHMHLRGQNDPSVQKWTAYYKAHPSRVRALLAPSQPWLWHIVNAIEARGMPMEVALLPVIESNFNPRARSPSGAVGIWQFVEVTGRNYGLVENDWYSGRQDVIASTEAALDYLARLHDIFDNWLLALAAYNVGENRLIAEQRKQLAKMRRRDFWSMPLPEETRGHVPRLLGFGAAVCSGVIPLPAIKNAPLTEIVTLPGPIDLQIAADWSRTPVSTLFALNPGLRSSVTDPEGPHRLVLPISRVETFKNKLATATPSQLVRYDRHTIQGGDTLIAIAARYGSSVDAIRRVNGIHGSLIKVGRSLLIPRRGLPAGTAGAPLIASAATSRRQKTEYVVQIGDSLWTLARRFGVSQKELESWNDLSRDGVLRIGRKLTIWLPDETDLADATTPDA